MLCSLATQILAQYYNSNTFYGSVMTVLDRDQSMEHQLNSHQIGIL